MPTWNLAREASFSFKMGRYWVLQFPKVQQGHVLWPPTLPVCACEYFISWWQSESIQKSKKISKLHKNANHRKEGSFPSWHRTQLENDRSRSGKVCVWWELSYWSADGCLLSVTFLGMCTLWGVAGRGERMTGREIDRQTDTETERALVSLLMRTPTL